jgi:signal transduction histidine kinase
MDRYGENGKRILAAFLGACLLLGAGLAAAGYRYYRRYEEHYRDQVARQLAAVADMKVDELENWRRERLGDAQMFHQNPAFAALVARHLEDPGDAQARAQLQHWLDQCRSNYQYDQVRLLDPRGIPRLSAPVGRPPPSTAIISLLPQVLGSGQVLFADFYRSDHDQRVYLALLVPILHPGQASPIAVLTLRIDPETYLYPFIRTWPTPSWSAETLLVRREENEVLYLNALRFLPDSALNLRLPLARHEVPAVRAALGQEGMAEGVDYRGAPVLAALRAIPGSPWFLVARMDEAEVSAPLRARAWETGAFAGALFLSLAAAAMVAWRQQQLRSYRVRHEAEVKYRDLFAHLPTGFAYCQMLRDGQGRPEDFVYLLVNEHFGRLTGLEEVVGKRVSEVIPGIREQNPELFEIYGRVAATGAPEAFEIEVKALGRWFAVTAYCPERGYFVALFDNVTARKEAERQTALSLALQRVRNQVLQMQGEQDWEKVFAVFDQELRGLVEYNAASINLIDWEHNRVASHGWNPAQGFHVNHAEPIHPALKETVEAGRHVHRRRGEPLFGRELLPEVNAVVDVPFLGGTVALNTTRPEGFGQAEIEVLLQFAPALSEAYRRLQDLQALARAERNLLQAQKMEAVGQLAGGVAHDFNNLLTVVTVYAELLLRRPQDKGSQEEALGEILKAAERGSGLVRQLLAFSRRQMMQPEVLDLNAVVGELGRMLRPLLREDIELAFDLAPDLGRVKADRGQLEQVLMNLAVNARDAMPQGGRLLIGTANFEMDAFYVQQHGAGAPGPYAALSVSDTGTGMDAATQARIFEPFFTTKEPGQGTGLGLSTVYGIVKQSGGYIWVYSEPGRGTTFRIYLPRVEEMAAAEAAGPAAAEAAGGGQTLLLVEDEETLRRLMALVLTGAGYQVLAAGRGEEALELGRRHAGTIHLLVTDMVMPGMSGRELAEDLRRLRPELKVLYISGYSEEIAAHQGRLSPDALFLQKPFREEQLLRQVGAALRA